MFLNPRRADEKKQAALSGRSRPHQFRHSYDLYEPLHVVRQDMQAHLRTYALERFGQEARGAHPVFQCAKGMFDSASPHAHQSGRHVQPQLHRFQAGFVFIATDPTVLAGRALRAFPHSLRPMQPVAQTFLNDCLGLLSWQKIFCWAKLVTCDYENSLPTKS